MPRHRFTLSVVSTAIAIFVGSLGLGLPMAAAQTDDLTIPDSTVIRGNPGDVVELQRLAVDPSLVGPLCTWTATVTNQASVHPNSDVLVESNGTTLVVADVEATPNQVTSNSGSVALASEVVVSIRLGPDGSFSGGMDVTIDYSMCGSMPTTTVAATTSTINEVSTTAEQTTSAVTATEPTTVSEPSTTEPEVAGPEVTADDSTSTTAPATTAPATTAPETTQEAAPTTMDTNVLPVTGSGLTSAMVVVGFLSLGCGLALSAAARQRR